MTEQEVTRLLKTLAVNEAVRAPECPDEHELAAYVDGSLPADTAVKIQHHLAECDFCVRQVGLLSRLRDETPAHPASEFLLARARRLGAGRRPVMPVNTCRWATAAVVVLAIALLLNWAPDFLPGGDEVGLVTGENAGTLPKPLQSRNREYQDDAPRLLTPATSSKVDPRELQISWTETPGSLYYEVRIVSDEGELIWQDQVEGTESGIPESLVLIPGAEYFVRVDAYLASARTLSSNHMPFTVEE